MNGGTGRSEALRWLPIVGIVVLVLVAFAIFLGRLTNEARATLSKLDSAASRLESVLESMDPNAVARRAGDDYRGVCGQDQGVTGVLEELRDRVRDLTRGVADIRFELEQMSDAPAANAGSERATGPATNVLPLPLAPRILGMGVGPAPGTDAGSVALGADGGISEAARGQLERALRGQAARVRQRIEMEAADPQNPEPDLMLRVMEESQEELISEMRGALDPKDFDALFPFERSPPHLAPKPR